MRNMQCYIGTAVRLAACERPAPRASIQMGRASPQGHGVTYEGQLCLPTRRHNVIVIADALGVLAGSYAAGLATMPRHATAGSRKGR